MGWIELRPHDPSWEEEYEAEQENVRSLAGDGLLGIFHVSSTSIPGLPAKPIIDILAIYATPSAVHEAKESLVSDYRIRREEANFDDGESRVVLVKEERDPPITLHLRPRDAQGWRDQFVFRELLRDNPVAKAKYEGAKRTAVAEYPDDGERYTAAKEPVIESLVERAYAEGYDERLPEF